MNPAFTKDPLWAADAGELVIALEDYGRLRELTGNDALAEELDRATVVPEERMPDNIVTMNSRCIYIDESAGVRREVELVYPEEADPARGKISVMAPVGSALLGLSVGRAIEWVFPDGRPHRLRVERVFTPAEY